MKQPNTTFTLCNLSATRIGPLNLSSIFEELVTENDTPTLQPAEEFTFEADGANMPEVLTRLKKEVTRMGAVYGASGIFLKSEPGTQTQLSFVSAPPKPVPPREGFHDPDTSVE